MSSEIAPKGTITLYNNKDASKIVIEDRKSQHFMVHTTLTASGTFTPNILISFNPSKLIVHYSYYTNNGTENGLSLIRCNGILNETQGYLCPIRDGQFFPKTEFLISRPISGNYLFEVVTYTDTIDTTRTGEIYIDLEFIE